MSFNPNQPRVPAGSPGGGQFASGDRVSYTEGTGVMQIRGMGTVVGTLGVNGQLVKVRPDKIGVFQPPEHITKAENVSRLAVAGRLPSAMPPQARLAVMAHLAKQANAAKPAASISPKLKAQISERNRLMEAGKPVPPHLRNLQHGWSKG